MAVFSAEQNEVALPCLDEQVSLTEEERDNEVPVEVPESSARNIVEIPPITKILQNERQVNILCNPRNRLKKVDGVIEGILFTMDLDSPGAFDQFMTFVTNGMFTAGSPDSTTESRLPDGDTRNPSPPALGFMPFRSADGSDLAKQRMQLALKHLESPDMHILAQLWTPVKKGDCHLLTTSQPGFLIPRADDLHHYIKVSLTYAFSVGEDNDSDLEPVGRVFRQKLPEWTQNVQYYSSTKYPRLNHALQYSVRGTLALTLFESSGDSLVGVLELIVKSEKISYASEAVSLKSAPAEIMRVFERLCEFHRLPFAQTWIPWKHRSVAANVSGFDGSFVGQVCMTTTDTFYITNPVMWAFRQACENRLLKGKGVVGKAFLSKSACFCEDVTQISKSEYPLVHYARMFGLSSSFVIYVQSSDTADEEYVLEFFLPPCMLSSVERETFVESLLMTMDKNFRSLKAVSLRSSEIFEYPITQKNPSNEDMAMFSAEHNNIALPCLDGQVSLMEEERDNEVRVEIPESSAMNIVQIPPITEISQNETPVDTVASKQNGEPISSSQIVYRTAPLSSKDIEQQFGKNQDAAMSLGVGVSTLKRACRDNGIERWPYKRNKAKSSHSKINHTFDKHVTDGQPSSSNPRPMYTAGVADMSSPSVIVKATCGVSIIRFRLSTSSLTMADLLGNITQRLPLTEGSFEIKYKDNNSDWILIACDEDIEECIRLLNDDNRIINMSLVML